ncbi:hypothetical protein DHW03_02005 [Pedobacter yonginense]|uniref:Uncharacterized protein n=1 Tax=Pedobacter yonginense TaxID=651869 RepID=A0A317EPR5_9SPHI|nr:hypothetical protein DHW03_02005 [Pedobacter yonginense]
MDDQTEDKDVHLNFNIWKGTEGILGGQWSVFPLNPRLKKSGDTASIRFRNNGWYKYSNYSTSVFTHATQAQLK